MARHILKLVCPDRPGIVHSIAAGLLEVDANILTNAQFSDPESKRFCIRTLFETSWEDAGAIADVLRERADALDADFSVRNEEYRPRMLVMVSQYDHCLLDLIYRWGTGELAVDIPIVVSNHPDLALTVTRFGLRFEHVPVSQDARSRAEARLLQLVDELDVDLIVLARYMQILSDGLCARLQGRIINIHHSFLPGFKGARPYHQAYERGVKLIGATAHYVTADLDEGPIIDQDTEPVTHAHTPEQMVEIGRDVERLVLSRAVKAHAEDRVFLLGRRTVVFP